MIKLTVFAVRKADMSHAEFVRYWRDQHAPLVKSVTEFSRHVRRYVQCHGVSSALPLGVDGDYDGIGELWFDDTASMEQAFSEPRYLEIIRPDELKFVDIDNCLSYVSEEIEMI